MLRAIAVPTVGRMEKTLSTWIVVHIQPYIVYFFIIISNIIGIYTMCICACVYTHTHTIYSVCIR